VSSRLTHALATSCEIRATTKETPRTEQIFSQANLIKELTYRNDLGYFLKTHRLLKLKSIEPLSYTKLYKSICLVRFQVLTATSMNMAAFWDVAPRILVDINGFITIVTEAVSSSETSVNIYQTTLCNTPDTSHLELFVSYHKRIRLWIIVASFPFIRTLNHELLRVLITTQC
jgi:hypothetical protein